MLGLGKIVSRNRNRRRRRRGRRRRRHLWTERQRRRRLRRETCHTELHTYILYCKYSNALPPAFFFVFLVLGCTEGTGETVLGCQHPESCLEIYKLPSLPHTIPQIKRLGSPASVV